MTARRGSPSVRPYLVAGAVSAAACAASALAFDDAREAWRHCTRWTARAAFVPFLVVFVAGSVWRMPLGASRRHWGLAFAMSHGIHLVCLTAYLNLAHIQPDMATLIGGGLGFVFTAVMALTSTDAWQRRLGRAWRRIHRTGLFILWVIFTYSYVGRMGDSDRFWIGLLGTVAAFGALGLRLVVPRLRRRAAAVA
jgi:methionine sulfoxide reductase heme-binding subunit